MWDAVKKAMDPGGGEREDGGILLDCLIEQHRHGRCGAVGSGLVRSEPSAVPYTTALHRISIYTVRMCCMYIHTITYPLAVAHPRISPCPMMKNFVAAGYGRAPGPEAPGRAWSPKWIAAAAISGALSAADCMIPLSTFPGECGGRRALAVREGQHLNTRRGRRWGLEETTPSREHRERPPALLLRHRIPGRSQWIQGLDTLHSIPLRSFSHH